MKVFHINSVPYGSTGSIMFKLSDALMSKGCASMCTTGFTWNKPERDDLFITSGFLAKSFHMVLSKISGYNGFFSLIPTIRLIRKIIHFGPDVIHLHNLHGWFLHMPLFFRFLKKHDIKVVWTLHDCWSFTGHCPHFMGIGCEKWKQECYDCSLHKQYPATFIDLSKTMFSHKKSWFTGLHHLVLVSPSNWLASRVKESFLSQYPVRVIRNGVHTDCFKPCDRNYFQKLGFSNQKIVLGVAYAWNRKKGLDVFCELAMRLGEEYRIVLVGTDPEVEKVLPSNITPIRRTANQAELASIYSSSDVFVNPTREDNYPTVNIEALSCGTPVVTFNTGGSPESVLDNDGVVVPCDDIDAMENAIRRICLMDIRACGHEIGFFDQKKYIDEYLELYYEFSTEEAIPSSK